MDCGLASTRIRFEDVSQSARHLYVSNAQCYRCNLSDEVCLRKIISRKNCRLLACACSLYKISYSNYIDLIGALDS